MSLAREAAAPSMIDGSVNSSPIWPRPVITMPGDSSCESPRSESRPPSSAMRMLAGLMSRCAMPRSWSAWAARAASRTAATARPGSSAQVGLLERPEREVLHRVVERAAVPAGVVDRDQPVGVGDAEVLQLPGGPAERVVGGRAGDHLDDDLVGRDAQSGRRVGQVVGAVVRLAQRPDELIVRDALHALLRWLPRRAATPPPHVSGAASPLSGQQHGMCHGSQPAKTVTHGGGFILANGFRGDASPVHDSEARGG